MRLIDLLSVCDDNLTVVVWNTEDCYLAEYNGKDSIDEKYNEWQVVNILGSGKGNLIDVVIKEV